jgi:adenosylcobinamide-GDP ribazoletransferase
MKRFLMALQFMTRIHLVRQDVWPDEDFGRSVVFFPLVGTVIGACLCGLYFIASARLAGISLAILVVTAAYFLTGGLHADGFMDTADGVCSGRSRDVMLQIMKDSRVGAHGVLAFVLLVLLKIGFFVALRPETVSLVLLGIPTASRMGTLVQIYEFPYARPAGLGRIFTAHGPQHVLLKGFGLSLLPLCLGPSYLILLGMALIVSVVSGLYLQRRIGGVTGDTYGAVTEWTEMVLLALSAIIF